MALVTGVQTCALPICVQVGVTNLATGLWRIVMVADDPAPRLGLLPCFEVALEPGGGQFTALAQLAEQRRINRRMGHEQVACSNQLILVDTRRSTLEKVAQGCPKGIRQEGGKRGGWGKVVN